MLADNAKSIHLSDRNLVRYTNQCALAKSECEKRIVQLGGPDHRTMNFHLEKLAVADKSLKYRGTALGQNERVLRLSEILSDGLALSQFHLFLEKFHDEVSLKFWLACQSLRYVNAVVP